MAAYVRQVLRDFVVVDRNAIVGKLQNAYGLDGFSTQYTRATQAWLTSIPLLQGQLRTLLDRRPEAGAWTVLLEYPLYRLRRRVDAILLAGSTIIVVEFKVGAKEFLAADRRQVEEYALDLRDFHAESYSRCIVPVLWATDAAPPSVNYMPADVANGPIGPVACVGKDGLADFLTRLNTVKSGPRIVSEAWDTSPYKPVPSVIEAATSIFAGHDVRALANADADNLNTAAERLIELIHSARTTCSRYLLILSGVPGSGKTLAGLHVVHRAQELEYAGDIVYLSGNTPLVTVLREALARDEYRRNLADNKPAKLDSIRRDVRARIQHINDFLHQGMLGSPNSPPHDHVIVFDEAQRAWDEKQGMEKFQRTASEPSLILELMARHRDWCVCVCLIGSGQEINSGEEGVFGWGDALRKLEPSERARWKVYAPPDVVGAKGKSTLGVMPADIEVCVDQTLHLNVTQRSYRSPSVSRWVNEVLEGNLEAAKRTAGQLGPYPIRITRSKDIAKMWLRAASRGERRYGLLASSGARRLRADGLGTTLNATAGAEIAHWYLNEQGDIRSSFALEVPANEYTCQGLELDFACLCWGGDLLWDKLRGTWSHWRLSGNKWQRIGQATNIEFAENSYRVLLTRAREGMVLWVPQGDDTDCTRPTKPLDATAEFLVRCGAVPIEQ